LEKEATKTKYYIIMQVDRPIIIAVTLFVILLLVFFLVNPEYKTFQALQLELGKKTAEYTAKYDYYAQISTTYFDLQSKKDDIKKIDDALPENPDLGKIIYFFQQTAVENGMMIKSLFLSKSPMASSANSSTNKNTVNDISFSIDLLGDYSSVAKFIVTLEKSSRLFEVTNISFGSASAPQTSTSSQTSLSAAALAAQAKASQVQTTFDFRLEIKTHSY
jgi:Tfp pilus assembly protein PilO